MLVEFLVVWIWQGYDVVAIASPERHVTGLDISENAIKKAAEVRLDYTGKIKVPQYKRVEFTFIFCLKCHGSCFPHFPKHAIIAS